MDPSAFESGTQGKSLRVYLVNPPLEDPWRTLGDYKKEQEESRERHQMLIEQHRLMLSQQSDFQKTLRWSMLTSVGTLVIAIGTLVLAFYAVPASKVDNPKNTPLIEGTVPRAPNAGSTTPDR
jgi:cytochrome c oxidase assembly protein Cox11